MVAAVSSKETMRLKLPYCTHFQIQTPPELIYLSKNPPSSSSTASDLVVFLFFLFLFPKTRSLNPLIGCDRMGSNASGQLNPVAECWSCFYSRKETQIYS